MSTPVTKSVEAMTGFDSMAPTAPLHEFRVAYEEDDNWWWRIACGHHQNLFDSAIEYIDELEAVIEKADHDQCGCLGGSCRIP